MDWEPGPPEQPGYYFTWTSSDGDDITLGHMNGAGAFGLIDGDVWERGDYASNGVNGMRWWYGPLPVPSPPYRPIAIRTLE